WDARSDALADLERTFNETGDYGLLPVMGDFWNSWEDLADNPEGIAQRVSVVEKSKIMTATINSMDTDLRGQERILDQKVENTVLQINGLAAQLADLNQKIADNEQLGNDANDLRDRRNHTLEQLAEMIDINYFEDEMFQVTVLTANGKSLVQGVQSYELKVDYDRYSGEPLVIWHDDFSAINDSLTGGNLKGHLDSWHDLQAARDDLRELAAGMIYHVNRLHVQGYGLDGSTGNLFFTHAITVNQGMDNRGDGVLTFDASQGINGVDWANLHDYDDYQIQLTRDYAGAGDEFKVIDLSTGEEVAGSEVTIDTSIASQVGISFRGYHLHIDYSAGAPRAGDTFTVSFRDQATRTMGVNPVLEDPVKIAAADNPLELPGNNGTALSIAQLQHQLTMASG
ncbi:MAG: hypothetical protein JRJ56_00415, partial [Deltaproteobacteria bacterium]|nr:hypothetical protein [Deltaproteobacteria bacterium]